MAAPTGSRRSKVWIDPFIAPATQPASSAEALFPASSADARNAMAKGAHTLSARARHSKNIVPASAVHHSARRASAAARSQSILSSPSAPIPSILRSIHIPPSIRRRAPAAERAIIYEAGGMGSTLQNKKPRRSAVFGSVQS